MNTYNDVILAAFEKFQSDLLKTQTVASSIVNCQFDKDTAYALFSKDHDITYALSQPRSLESLEYTFKNRLLQTSWRSFFTSIELYAHLGSDVRDKITAKYEMKYSRYDNKDEVEFSIENLTNFVKTHLTVDESKDSEIPKNFLRCHVGSWKNRKTEYKTRITVNTFTDGSRVYDRTQQAICELVSMIARKHQNVELSVKTIKEKIGHQYGVKEIDCNLTDGVDFKLKPNGNAELKFSKDIVEFLNNSL